MNQDEQRRAVIIGIASDAAKAVRIWEAFRKLFLDYTEEIIEALTPIAESLAGPLLFGVDEPRPSVGELENSKSRRSQREHTLRSGVVPVSIVFQMIRILPGLLQPGQSVNSLENPQ